MPQTDEFSTVLDIIMTSTLIRLFDVRKKKCASQDILMQLILIEKNTPTKLQTIQSSKKKKMLLELII